MNLQLVLALVVLAVVAWLLGPLFKVVAGLLLLAAVLEAVAQKSGY
jgi:hypothetical protein